MSDQTQIRPPIDPNVDLYGHLGLTKNPDGSITRLPEPPGTPASADPSNSFHLTKDLTINQSKGTWARIFVPKKAFDSASIKKLPMIIYFHGGAFIWRHVNTPLLDGLYTAIVTEIPAVIFSVDYRLAPEHRLPAAYDDCMEALQWINKSTDEWLAKYADFSRCFLMGTSAGGNIAYHVGLSVAACVDDLMPLQIKGLILHQAVFGGTKRSDSELRLANDKVVPLTASDLMWELTLPIGVDRDHEYCNPMVGMKLQQLELIKVLGWKILAIGCDGDPFTGRQIELVKKLEENGISVTGKFDKGGYHGYEIHEPTKAKELAIRVKVFVESVTTS